MLYFTPGPSHLYPTYATHLQKAMELDLGAISHRGKTFQGIYKNTYDNLKALIGLPEGWKILFTGSGTEVWEKLLMSCVEKESYHFVNGSFSKRFYEFAVELGLNAVKNEAPFGQGFSVEGIQIPSTAEMICVTHNETSSGVMFPAANLKALRKAHPNALIAVDAVSSFPYPDFDFDDIDSVFFSVQKALGMPAGLGVWLVNERTMLKAEAKKSSGTVVGAHHTLLSLAKNFEKFETPATPNVMAIYILGQIAGDMAAKGIAALRQETDHKAQMMYDYVAQSAFMNIFVTTPAHRSATVVVADVADSAAIISKLKAEGITLGSGYGSYKEKQLRIANFPALSVADFERLITALNKIA